MKFVKALIKTLLLIVLGAVLMILVIIITPFGSSPGNGTNSSGTAHIVEDVHAQQQIPKEEVTSETPVVVIENNNFSVSPQPEEIQEISYTFTVKNLDVFLNNRKIDYAKNNVESLVSLIQNELLSIKDDTKVILDFTRGDYNICINVEKAVKSLGIEFKKIE